MAGAVHDCTDFHGLDHDVQQLTEAECLAQADSGVMPVSSESAGDTTGAIGGCQISLGGTAFKIDWFFPGNPYNDVPSVEHFCTTAVHGTFVPTPTPGDP